MQRLCEHCFHAARKASIRIKLPDKKWHTLAVGSCAWLLRASGGCLRHRAPTYRF